MEFPTWMYHKEHGARLFNDEDDFARAGGGWVDTLAKLSAAEPAPTPAPTPAPSLKDDDVQPLDREALKARAAELGIVHAPNIKTDKLAELVAAADKGE